MTRSFKTLLLLLVTSAMSSDANNQRQQQQQEQEIKILRTLLETAVERLDRLESKVQGQSVKVDSQEMRLGEAERKIESILLLKETNSEAADNEIMFSRKRLKRSPQPSSNSSRIVTKNKSKMKIIKSEDEDTQEKQTKASANPHAIMMVQYRSCHEIFVAYSGQVASKLTYNQNKFRTYIDPDGLGIGDPPISVECDMTNGTTKVIPFVEKEEDDAVLLNPATNIQVENCHSPGCSVHEIDYSVVSLRQLVALSQISSECRQFIRYDCLGSVMQHDGVPHAFWIDRNGTKRHFWVGNETDQVMCQCGLDQSCIDRGKKCNCDSLALDRSTRFDQGYITDKNLLPVTRLNFGRTLKSGPTGRFTLGPFECSGRHQLLGDKIPTNCMDLFHLGHIHSGFYLVSNDGADDDGKKISSHPIDSMTTVKMIYCDFNRLPFGDRTEESMTAEMKIQSIVTAEFQQLESKLNSAKSILTRHLEELNNNNQPGSPVQKGGSGLHGPLGCDCGKGEIGLQGTPGTVGPKGERSQDGRSITVPKGEACRDNVIEATKLLVHFGLRDDVNYKDKRGYNILLYVTENYDHPNLIELIKYLITNGVDAKEKTSGWTALHMVCRYYTHSNLINIVRLLIETGVDVTAKLNDNWTALLLVSRYYSHDNLIDIVKLLIENGVDVNSKLENWTAFHFVCYYYRHDNLIDIARILISNGAEVTAKDNYNWTALHLVCRQYPHDNLIDIFRLLMEKGADVKAMTKDGYDVIQLLRLNENISNPTPFIELFTRHGGATV